MIWRALCVALALTQGAFADSVRIATEPGFPPYVFRNNAGEIDGFDRELGDALCRRARLDCIWVAVPFDTLLSGLVACDFDAVMAGMGISETREKIVAFSQPYVEETNSVDVLVGLPGASQDLTTAKIAVQAGTLHHERLTQDGRNVMALPTNQAALEAVTSGAADLMLGTATFLQLAILTSHRELEIIMDHPSADGGTAIAFRKDDTALRSKFDLAIETMRFDGSLARLEQRWFPPTEEDL